MLRLSYLQLVGAFCESENELSELRHLVRRRGSTTGLFGRQAPVDSASHVRPDRDILGRTHHI